MWSGVWPRLPSSSRLLISHNLAALYKLLLYTTEASAAQSKKCCMEQAAGKVLPVSCCSVIADNFMALRLGKKRMRSGQGCVHTCILPGEVYQVQQLLSWLQVIRSFVQPHSVRWRGSWIFLLCRFFCKTVQPQSVIFFIFYFLTGYLIYRVCWAFIVS